MNLLRRCEVCGKVADIHHIVHKCQGGVDFPLNYKYLCVEHHRGKYGPHRDSFVDIEYKLELQSKLQQVLHKRYYSLEELIDILELNKSKVKKILSSLKLYKEGYYKEEIIYKLMGSKRYEEYMLEEYKDFIPIYFSV